MTGIGFWSEEHLVKPYKMESVKGLDNSKTLLPPMPGKDANYEESLEAFSVI